MLIFDKIVGKGKHKITYRYVRTSAYLHIRIQLTGERFPFTFIFICRRNNFPSSTASFNFFLFRFFKFFLMEILEIYSYINYYYLLVHYSEFFFKFILFSRSLLLYYNFWISPLIITLFLSWSHVRTVFEINRQDKRTI